MIGEQKFLIVIDFLSQKYEIEYEEYMTAQDVIRKVQRYLFPSERREDLIPKNEEDFSYEKLGLYRKEVSDSIDFKGASFVTGNIKPEECDFKKYLFFLFRPLMNVYLSLYVVFPEKVNKRQHIAFFNLIYPIKKRSIVLKNYLKDQLIKYTKGKEQFTDHPIIGFKLQFVRNLHEFEDEEYIEQSMNGKEMYVIVLQESNINQNPCWLGRFYYFMYGHINQPQVTFSKDGESLDYYDMDGLTLKGAKKKLIEKHYNGVNYPEEKVVILFNGAVQTYKFNRLDDLFCDNDFYQFVVIFESDINKHISQIPQSGNSTPYNISVPEETRPYILNFEFAGEPKHELMQSSLNNNSAEFELNSNSNDSSFINEISINDSTSNSNDLLNEPRIENNNNSNNNVNIDSSINLNNNHENNINYTNNDAQDENNQSTEKINSNELSDGSIIEEEEECLEEKDGDSLLDMFCYYFIEFSKENQKINKKAPLPTYFNNLSCDEVALIKTFNKYYHLYRQSDH